MTDDVIIPGDVVPGDIVKNKAAAMLHENPRSEMEGAIYPVSAVYLAFVVATYHRNALLLIDGMLLWADTWEWYALSRR